MLPNIAELISLISFWAAASVLAKIAFYMGALSLGGGALCLIFFNDRTFRNYTVLLRYIIFGSLVGIHAEVMFFILKVGELADAGLFGMFDIEYAKILWNTPIGVVLRYRSLAFSLALIMALITFNRVFRLASPPGKVFFLPLLTIQGIALLLIISVFEHSGHVSVLDDLSWLAVGVHFLAFSCWIGSLFPLNWILENSSTVVAKNLLIRFSVAGSAAVGLMVTTGIYLTYRLTGLATEAFFSAYGQHLILKVAFVLFILIVAAFNKWRFVPELNEGDEASRLFMRRSLRVEVFLSVIVLLITAYLSSQLSPMFII